MEKNLASGRFLAHPSLIRDLYRHSPKLFERFGQETLGRGQDIKFIDWLEKTNTLSKREIATIVSSSREQNIDFLLNTLVETIKRPSSLRASIIKSKQLEAFKQSDLPPKEREKAQCQILQHALSYGDNASFEAVCAHLDNKAPQTPRPQIG